MVGKPTIGQTGWGATLNASLDELDAAVVAAQAAAAADASAKVAASEAAASGTYLPLVTTQHLAMRGKTDATNADIYIGAGAGSLTDVSVMGVKVKIDTTAEKRCDGIQSNVNVVSGAAANGSVKAIVGRVDVRDATSTGDTVALWGDTIVWAASPRPTWGLNCYTTIETGVAYSGAAVGGEISVENNGTLDQIGGVLHLTTKGTKKSAFGLLINSSSAQQSKNHLMLDTGVYGPTDNHIWVGARSAGNAPSGTPVLQLNAAGELGLGASPVSGTSLTAANIVSIGEAVGATAVALQVKRASVANPRLEVRADARIAFGSGAASTDTHVGRVGAGQFGTVTGTALTVGSATAASGNYFQMWESTADPSAPPADSMRMFLRDNGAGKTQLCARFATGAIQVLSTEP